MKKNGTFTKNDQRFSYQIRSDGFHLVWGEGLIHYRDQFKVDEAAHRMMEKVKGADSKSALVFFERLSNAQVN